MRRKAAVLLCALAVASLAAPAARAANGSVAIQNFSFQPSNVTINPGESVTWTQQDVGTQHTVTADDNSFGSGNLATGQTYAHTFAQPGTFAYHCNIHPSMMGTVTVTGGAPPPAPSPAPTPAPAPPPAPTAAPRTTAAPTTTAPTTTTSSTTTTIAPPAAADVGTTSSTTAAAGGGVALPATKSSSGDDGLNPWLVTLAVVLALGAGTGGILLRQRQA